MMKECDVVNITIKGWFSRDFMIVKGLKQSTILPSIITDKQMTEYYIDREFRIPACAHLALSGLAGDPSEKMNLDHPIFMTKEYTGRKKIIFEYSEMVTA